jgi:hypothetical protein
MDSQQSDEFDRHLLQVNQVKIFVCVPSNKDIWASFSSVLSNKYMRPILICVENNSDVDFLLTKERVILNTLSCKEIHKSSLMETVPGLFLFCAGCLSNSYIGCLSLIASGVTLWHQLHAYMFFERKVLKDNESVLIKSKGRIEKIVVVYDQELKGSFDIYLRNMQSGFEHAFFINIIQNKYLENVDVMLEETTYA